MSTPTVYYCGCIDAAGHYIWWPGWRRTCLVAPSSWPELFRQSWGHAHPRHEQVDGWSLVCVLDYTVDHRPGSHSTVIAEGEHTADELWELLREHFPLVHSRLVKGGVLNQEKTNVR